MKWIKASERLPETGIGFLKYVWVRNTDTKCGCMHALENLLKLDGLNNIEWLDESTPVPDKVEAKKDDKIINHIRNIKLLEAVHGGRKFYVECCPTDNGAKCFPNSNMAVKEIELPNFDLYEEKFGYAWQSTQSDAVEFGEWLKTFEPLTKEHGQWVLDCQISSEQLYQLFKQSK